MTSDGLPTRPPHLTGVGIALVAAGGAVGTGARYLIQSALPPWAGVPVATVAINVLGAFLLGALLERLAAPGGAAVRARRLRLLAGTGGLGGFTTYSALATDTVSLLATHPGRALGYALATVLAGAAASVLGIWLSRRHRPPAAASVSR